MPALTIFGILIALHSPAQVGQRPIYDDPIGGRIFFSGRRLPVHLGALADYLQKLDKLNITSIGYGKNHRVALHFAAFFRRRAEETRLEIAFVPSTDGKRRPRFRTVTAIRLGSIDAYGVVNLREKTLGDGTFDVEARVAGGGTALGTIELRPPR